MTLVLNKDYGGFFLPRALCEELGINRYSESIETRTDPRVIEWLRSHPDQCGDLKVIETHGGEITDFFIDEYDGFETLTYVIDGKLHFC